MNVELVQDNHWLLAYLGKVRELHFQAPRMRRRRWYAVGPARFFDVAVDIRCGSSAYGKLVGLRVSAENRAQLYIPADLAHSFVTLEADSEIVYKCSDYSAPEAEGSLRWEEQAIGFDWRIIRDAILSDRAANVPLLANLCIPF